MSNVDALLGYAELIRRVDDLGDLTPAMGRALRLLDDGCFGRTDVTVSNGWGLDRYPTIPAVVARALVARNLCHYRRHDAAWRRRTIVLSTLGSIWLDRHPLNP